MQVRLASKKYCWLPIQKPGMEVSQFLVFTVSETFNGYREAATGFSYRALVTFSCCNLSSRPRCLFRIGGILSSSPLSRKCLQTDWKKRLNRKKVYNNEPQAFYTLK